MFREDAGEASVPEHYTRANLKPWSALLSNVPDRRRQSRLLVRVQIFYELQLPQDIIPKPRDAEIEEFTSKTLAKVQDALASGEFKLKCAMSLDGVLYLSRQLRRRQRS